jgi:hypothetical protein
MLAYTTPLVRILCLVTWRAHQHGLFYLAPSSMHDGSSRRYRTSDVVVFYVELFPGFA